MASVSVQPASGTGVVPIATDAVTRDGQTEDVQIIKVMDGTPGSLNNLVVNADGSINVNQVGVSSAVKASAQSIGTAAAQLASSPLANRRSILITNNSSTATLYVGDSAVTTASGTPVGPQQSLMLDAGPALALYAIASAAGTDTRLLEIA